MSDINLLQTPTQTNTLFISETKRFFARILMFVLLIAVVAYGYLYFDLWNTNKSIASTEKSITKSQSEAFANKDRLELLTRQGQAQQLDTLIKGHLYWSYLLPELARISLKSARYTSIEADGNGKLNLAVALPNYTDLEKFMQIFDLPEYNKQFSNVRIVSITKIQTETAVEVLVRLQLIFDPSFIKNRI